MPPAIAKFIQRLIAGASASPATTTVAAIPLLCGAIVQILYGFDADPQTRTDWNIAITSIIGAVGFTLAQDQTPASPMHRHPLYVPPAKPQTDWISRILFAVIVLVVWQAFTASQHPAPLPP